MAEEQRTRHIKEQTPQCLVNNKQRNRAEDLGNTHPIMNGKIKQVEPFHNVLQAARNECISLLPSQGLL